MPTPTASRPAIQAEGELAVAKMSGGEALVKSLVREGVEVVFGIGGIHMSGIIVALRDEPSIRVIKS